MGDPKLSGPPPSLERVLALARKQSQQLERVASVIVPNDATKTNFQRRNTIGRKSLSDRDQSHRLSEIQPVADLAESSTNQATSSPPGTLRSRGVVEELRSSEQLKEPSASGVQSAPKTFTRKDLSYEAFAKANFRTQHACFGHRPIEDLIKFSERRISDPLLQSVNQQSKHDAVAVFAHLMAYMGDLTRTKSETDHLLQILSAGLRKPILRDEVFCQICKQTTSNPDSVSNARGWQAMAISCGLFAPSDNFLPILEAHLEQVGQGAIVATKEKSDKSVEQVLDPSHLANYCLFRLRKLAQVGARHLLPLPEEISAVEKMGKITATIFLPDSTSKSMPFDPMVTTEEVVTKIVQILGLSEPKYFSLWEVDSDQVEKSLGKREYVAEVQSRWAATCIPQSVNDFQSPLRRCMTCWRRTHKKIATITDLGDSVLDHLFVTNKKGDHKPKLLFKRNLFLTSPDVAIAMNIANRELALDYSQATHDVLRGAYPLAEQDLVMLAALQLRAELGSNLPRNATGMQMNKFLPQRLEKEVEKLKSTIVSIAVGLPMDPSPATRRVDYLDYLKTRYILSEASWYSAKQVDNSALPESFLVAINTAGIYFLKHDTMEEILHLKYTDICSWAYSQTYFSIVTGNATHNEDHRLITLQGPDMSQVMQLYVNRLF